MTPVETEALMRLLIRLLLSSLLIAAGPVLAQVGAEGEAPHVAQAFAACQSCHEAPQVFDGRRTLPLNGYAALAAIPDDELQAMATTGRGRVKGRRVAAFSVAQQETLWGRFGSRAVVPTLTDQTGLSLATDLGHETPPDDLAAIIRQIAALPLPRSRIDPEGLRIFEEIGCADCHRVRYQLPDGSQIMPFTDLLLHDMGEIIGGRPEGTVPARHWRTTPLWGLSERDIFLHDGSAETVLDAVDAHEGAANVSRILMYYLPPVDAQTLMNFLEAL